jgi:RimJ/RimL family protein N-acetyltransferase
MVEDGKITAGVLYDMYNGRSICMHVAVEKPVSRRFTQAAFFYPFEFLKVQKVMGLVDSTNEKALSFDRKLGFVEEARIADAGKYGDLVILTMTRPQCRWIK